MIFLSGFMKNKLFFSLSLVSYIGISTAMPLVIFGLGGRYLDGKYHSSPKFFIVGIAIAALISFFTLRTITSRAIKVLGKEDK